MAKVKVKKKHSKSSSEDAGESGAATAAADAPVVTAQDDEKHESVSGKKKKKSSKSHKSSSSSSSSAQQSGGASSTAAGASSGASTGSDLTLKLASHLDRHLVLPLLDFAENKLSLGDGVMRAKLDLLRKTSLVEYAADVAKKVSALPLVSHSNAGDGEATGASSSSKSDASVSSATGSVTAGSAQYSEKEWSSRRAEVLAELARRRAACERLVKVVESAELLRKLKNEKDFHLEYLRANFEIEAMEIDALYDYAKFLFDCGQYAVAGELLAHFRALTSNAGRSLSALWGKLAADILAMLWDQALDDVLRLKDAIESSASPNVGGDAALALLQKRACLVHWSLFVCFNHPNGRNLLIDMYMSERYIHAIQMICPYVLRYVSVALVVSSPRPGLLKELVRVLQTEARTYSDAVTELLLALYVRYDFEEAQRLLGDCSKLLSEDFFLVAHSDEFAESARLYIFENYCRIHHTIDISQLAEKLQMDADSAERWIVNLIRQSHLDAKIDSANNLVVMGTKFPTVYQQVIDKTKSLNFRTSVLSNNLASLKLKK